MEFSALDGYFFETVEDETLKKGKKGRAGEREGEG